MEHVWFLVLEVFLWTKPTGRRTFGTTAEYAASTAALMKNQGTYNGFLAAGLVWAIASANRELACFFLGCVLVAACVGGLTVKRTILFVQGLPAAVALLVWIVRG